MSSCVERPTRPYKRRDKAIQKNTQTEPRKGNTESLQAAPHRKGRRKAQREAKAEPKPDAGIISGTLAAAFSDRYEIRRSKLYQFEIETAKAEGREPIGRNKFFRMVQAAGFYLKKKNTGFYFLKL